MPLIEEEILAWSNNRNNTLINHLMLIFKKTMYDMRTSTFAPSIYVLKKRVAKTMKIEYAVAQESNKLNYYWKKNGSHSKNY